MEDRPPFNLVEGLARRHRVVLATVGALLLVAAALSVFLPKTYEATAIIYLDTARTATDFDSGIAAGDLLQHDFIALATTRATLQEACATPGVKCSPGDMVAPETTIGKQISASVDRGTSEVAISARARNPADAAALANAVARAVIDQDAGEVVRLNQPARDNLSKELAVLSATMDSEQKALSSSGAGNAAAAHEAALARLQNAYAQTLARLLDLNERQDRLTNVATIVQPALPPTKPESPNLLVYSVAAVVAGVCLGVFVALLMERYDDRIYSAEALAGAAAVPLALVARPKGRLLRPASGSYSLALSNLLARWPDARTVLVVAASPRDDARPVAAGLGAAAADAGHPAHVINFNPESNGASSSPNGDLSLVAVPSPDVSPAAVMLGRSANHAALVATSGVTRYGEARRTAALLRESGIEVAAGILV